MKMNLFSESKQTEVILSLASLLLKAPRSFSLMRADFKRWTLWSMRSAFRMRISCWFQTKKFLLLGFGGFFGDVGFGNFLQIFFN